MAEQQPTYCICNGPDDGRVMIECDVCNEWYHGECVHMTDEECEKAETFICPRCKNSGAQKRKLDENDDEVLKKLRLEPEVFSGTIESKQTPPFKVTGRLLFGELTQKLPERIVLQGRMKLDELLTYFEKLKRASTSRKITAIYVDCDRNENFTKTFDHLYDSFKGAVIDKKDCAEGYVIPVKNQDLPKFFDAGVTLPASHIQHLLIVVVSQKVVPKPEAAKEQPKQEEAKSAEEKKEEPAKEAEKKE